MNEKVTLSYGALSTIIRHGLRFASPALPQGQWRECMGFLLGNDDQEGRSVTVTSAVPITHGDLVEVRFGPEHYAQADRINQTLTDENWVVGWYHTHPGHGLFLSETDRENQAGYQSLRDTAIALVFDPSKLVRGAPFRDYIQVFQVTDPAMLRHSGFAEIENVWARAHFPDVAEALRETTEAALRRKPIIAEFGEK